MSEVDPTKMKVVELRSELSVRGLDSKGNKAVLVRRLKTALAKEAGAVADENGADIGDLDTSYESQDDGKNDSQIDAEDELLKDEPMEGGAEDNEDESVLENNEDEILENLKSEEIEDEKTAEDNKDDIKMDIKEENDEVKVENDESAEVKTEGKSAEDGSDEVKKENGDKQRGQKRRRSRSRSRDGHKEKVEKHEPPPPLEDLEEFDSNLVILDIYVSDLNLKLDATRTSATPLHNNGFAFMWAGVKSVFGVKEGKIYYEVKVTKKEDVKHLPSEEANPHVVRVGVSDQKSGLQLGEEPLSYGFGGTGKFSTDCKFEDYGKTFSEDDVVQCFLDMESDPIQISYSVNGEHLGKAAEIPKESLNDSALYPHVLTKNCTFEVNFGQKEEPFFPLPEGYEDYQTVQAVELEKRVRGPVCPEKKEDCEMIMMCGLPGAGKTYWASEHTKNNADKMYNILGTNSIIDKMKVMGLPRKRNYHGRWDVLIEKSTNCLNKLFDIAFRRRRNYILDQTNVYASAQRRKMRPFEGFQRKAVVIVPTDDEFKARIAKRTKEEGKDVPDHAVLEMKASFSLPKAGDWFNSVEFAELQEEEAQKLVDQYRKEGQAAAPRKRFRRDDHRRNRDRRSGGHNDRGPRNFGGNRNRGPGSQNNRSWSSGGSSGGGRNWGGPDRGWNQGSQGGRNWGGNRSGGGSGGPSRGWNQGGPSGGVPNRRSWGGQGGGGGGGGRDSRDNYRGNPPRSQGSRYGGGGGGGGGQSQNRYSNSRQVQPSRGYGGGGGGGYNQSSSQQYQNYSQQNQPWNQQWSQWNQYCQYYQQQNQGYR